MAQISELMFTQGLGDDLERVTAFTSVEKYKKIRVCSISDVILQINLEWSYDGFTRTVASSYRTPSDQAKTDIYEVVLPYVRFRVINQTGRPNNLLTIYVAGVGLNKAVTQLKLEDKNKIFLDDYLLPALAGQGGTSAAPSSTSSGVNEVPEVPRGSVVGVRENLEENRGSGGAEVVPPSTPKDKAPFFRLTRKKVESSPKHTTCLDHRLPSFVPVGALLVGDRNGRVSLLAKGMPGDVLKISADGKPHWVSEFQYPPVSDPVTTRLLSAQKLEKMEE